MKIDSIINLTNGKVVTKPNPSLNITTGLTSDLMSDILTHESNNAILITGLNNLQTIRTAEMSDIECILVARNKKVPSEMISLANQNDITIIESPFTVFRVSGILFSNGINAIY